MKKLTRPAVAGAKLLAVLSVAALAACSLPNKPATQAATLASKPISNGEILQIMETVNMGEIKQAELAVQRSTNPAVRDLAQMIIRDHTALSQRIMSVSQSTGTKLDGSPLATGLRLQATEIADDLTKLSGQKFDCTYLQKQAEQHALTVKTARDQLLPAASQPQVRDLVSGALPSLEQHGQHAQRVRTSIGSC